MKEVKGKTAFITGGASGIGLCIAKVFAEAGMKVVIADLRRDHLDEAMEVLKQAGEVHPIQLDVSDRKAMAAAADEAEQVFSKVHLLCNNAGVNVIRPIDQATFEDFDWLLSVNLGGVINGVLTFLPRIMAHGEGGHIVNVSSIAGIITGPGTAVYSATKFGIRGLSDAMRFDLAPHGIHVSLLCPGTVSTRLYESEENRQDRFQGEVTDEVKTNRAGTGDLFRKVLPMGMDPMEVARKTLKGIQENRFYIFSHAESEIDIREAFEELLASLPDDPPNPQRMELEAGRRQKKYDLLKQLKDL